MHTNSIIDRGFTAPLFDGEPVTDDSPYRDIYSRVAIAAATATFIVVMVAGLWLLAATAPVVFG